MIKEIEERLLKVLYSIFKNVYIKNLKQDRINESIIISSDLSCIFQDEIKKEILDILNIDQNDNDIIVKVNFQIKSKI